MLLVCAAGVVAAVALLASATSFAAAYLLQRWQISTDGFEGVLMLAASVLVVTMIAWMNRIARTLKTEIEGRIEVYAQKSGRAGGWGVGFFVFLMVLREGAELVLILRAVELSTEGVAVWIGTVLGIAIAIAVGLFFFQGTLRIPLGRFFAVTSTILMVVAFQLALTGIHELSEAMWLPSSKAEMSTGSTGIEGFGTRTKAIVPIFVAGEFIGVVGFDNTRQHRAIEPSELAALETAAGVIGAALHRERLVDDVRRERQHAAPLAAGERAADEGEQYSAVDWMAHDRVGAAADQLVLLLDCDRRAPVPADMYARPGAETEADGRQQRTDPES